MVFFIFTLCRLAEIMVAPPLKIFPPPLTFFQNPAMLSNDEDSSLDGSKVL